MGGCLRAATGQKQSSEAYSQQKRNEVDSEDPSISPTTGNTRYTTPFHIPNAIAHTLLLPQSTCPGRCGEAHLAQCSCCSKPQATKLEQACEMQRLWLKSVAEYEFVCAKKTVEMYN